MSPTPRCWWFCSAPPAYREGSDPPGLPGSIGSGSGTASCCLLFFGDRGSLFRRRPACPQKSYLVVFSEPPSGIFSSEQLLPESLSRYSSSLKRSATHWAVSRASGSWSQHSVRVSHTVWMPCGWERRRRHPELLYPFAPGHHLITAGHEMENQHV